jgi:hypothetical protein
MGKIIPECAFELRDEVQKPNEIEHFLSEAYCICKLRDENVAYIQFLRDFRSHLIF